MLLYILFFLTSYKYQLSWFLVSTFLGYFPLCCDNHYVIGHFGHKQFYFSFSDFTLLFLFLLFYFEGWWRGMWQGSHMTDHMIWCHRPKTWWKDLEDSVRASEVHMVALSKTWGRNYYNLKLKGLSNRTTLVLSNTRELDRVPNTK